MPASGAVQNGRMAGAVARFGEPEHVSAEDIDLNATPENASTLPADADHVSPLEPGPWKWCIHCGRCGFLIGHVGVHHCHVVHRNGANPQWRTDLLSNCQYAFMFDLPDLVWLGPAPDGWPRYGYPRALMWGKQISSRRSVAKGIAATQSVVQLPPYEKVAATFPSWSAENIRAMSDKTFVLFERHGRQFAFEPHLYAYCGDCHILNRIDATRLRTP